MRIYAESPNQPSPQRPRQLPLYAHNRRLYHHFSLLTHQLLDATMPAATAQRITGGVA